MTDIGEMLRFDGQVAIVTGAGAGIGRAVAMELAGRGAKILVNDYGGDFRGNAGDVKSAEAVARAIRDQGGEAAVDETAMGTAPAAAAIVDKALQAFGRVDILINNAGVTLPGAFAETAQADIERIIDVNLWGAYHLMRAVWPLMQAQSYGRIVNFTSNAILGGYGNVAPYTVSKGGVLGLTADSGTEGRAQNIFVNAVVPIAYTRLAGSDITGPTDVTSLWLKQHFSPLLVAPAVTYLASRANQAVSGEIFCAAAGRVSRLVFANNDGFFHPELTAEMVVAQIGQIRDISHCAALQSGAEEMGRYAAYRPLPHVQGVRAARADEIEATQKQ